MKLETLKITNFKGIKDEITINLKDFNVIVGRNDVGKSTLLKALDCFLNDKAPINEDLNFNAENDEITIVLLFDSEQTSIQIDDTIQTTFEEEELINIQGKLEIKKIWDVSKSKIKSTTYIKRKKYIDNDFLEYTETQLMARCKELKIETAKANGEEFNNKEKREKLRNHHVTNEIGYNYEDLKLPTSGKTRTKKIHDQIKRVLPRFEYFKADSSLSETDTSIQKFFKEISLKTINEDIDTVSVEKEITNQLTDVLNKISQKINQVVVEEEKVEPAIHFDWSKLISINFRSKHEEHSLPLNSRGDGFRRITMMSYFEYLAEQNDEEKQNMIFGFEEPETFLHPLSQENLFNKLFDLTNNYQVFVTTHSPIIVANSNISDLTHVHKGDSGYIAQQKLEDCSGIIKDLGISIKNQFIDEFNRSNVLLLVEGIGDAVAFNHVCKVYKGNNLIDRDFDEMNIAVLPIGGCDSISHWVYLDLFKKFDKPFLIFQDSDKTSAHEDSPTRSKLISNGFNEGQDFIISKRRNMENYISSTALKRIVPDFDEEYGDFDNVKKICKNHTVADKLGGKKVLLKHFKELNFDEIRSTFCEESDDEFLNVYNKLKDKLSEQNENIQ